VSESTFAALAQVPLVRRLLVSLAVGLLVFGISSHVALRQFRGSTVRWTKQFTLRDMARVRNAVEEYRQREGVLPKALSDLLPVSRRVDETDWLLDRWWGRGRPLNYWTDGTGYRITSYGRDGKPGGVGLDYDLSTDDLPKKGQDTTPPEFPRQAIPTFGQFATDEGIPTPHVPSFTSGSGRMMFLGSILSGAVAFFLGFLTTRRALPTRRGRWGLAGRLLVTTAGTLFVATSYIVPLHLASGH